MSRKKSYTCVCGDAHFYFGYRKTPYGEDEIKKMFEERIKHWRSEVFPGLVLRDGSGQCYRPHLQITLEPINQNYE